MFAFLSPPTDVSDRQVSLEAPGQPSPEPLPRLPEPVRAGHQAVLHRIQRLQGGLLHRGRRRLPHFLRSFLALNWSQDLNVLNKLSKTI